MSYSGSTGMSRGVRVQDRLPAINNRIAGKEGILVEVSMSLFVLNSR